MQAAGLTDPRRMARASTPTSPGVALLTTMEVPSAKRTLAALGTGAASMARGGTHRSTSGLRRCTRRSGRSPALVTAWKRASISEASAGSIAGVLGAGERPKDRVLPAASPCRLALGVTRPFFRIRRHLSRRLGSTVGTSADLARRAVPTVPRRKPAGPRAPSMPLAFFVLTRVFRSQSSFSFSRTRLKPGP